MAKIVRVLLYQMPKNVVKRLLLWVKYRVASSPQLRTVVLAGLGRFPRLKSWAKGLSYQGATCHERDELTIDAQRLYDLFKQFCREGASQASLVNKNRLAFVSPLPPYQSGIADYTIDLLSSFSSLYDIDIITDTRGWTDSLGLPVYDVDYFRIHGHLYDKIIYQMGNNLAHINFVELIHLFPGIVVLHDFYLGDMFYAKQALNRGHAWGNALIGSHGYAAAYQSGCKGIEWAVKAYPANRYILQDAKAVVVHSRYAKALAEQYYQDAYINKFYHLPQVYNRKECSVDEAKTGFMVCSFGHLVEHKCIKEIVTSWIKAGLDKQKGVQLVFIGNLSADEYGSSIQSLIKSVGNIQVTGYVTEKVYRKYLSQAKLAIQLRRKSRGETSRAVLDCLAYGVPTIVNRHGSLDEISDDIVYKISDAGLEDELSEVLRKRVGTSCNLVLSEKAKAYIQQYHAPSVVSKKFADIVEKVYSREDLHTIRDIYASSFSSYSSFPEQEAANMAKEFDLSLRSISVPHIYVDISAVVQEDLKTGIQRVVRSVLISLFQMDMRQFRIVPVYLTNVGGYWHYRIASQYFNRLVGHNLFVDYDSVVEPASQDIFLGLDFYMTRVVEAHGSGLYNTWKARGVQITFIVYDMLPIQFPQYFPDGENVALGQKQWLNAIADVSKSLIAISDTVAGDVRAWLRSKQKGEHGVMPHISSFRLGADLESSLPSQGLPKEANDVLFHIKKKLSFLMVGTIEPRKGHAQVLEAFEKVWREEHDVNLVFVGKQGWLVEDVLDKVRAHPELNKRLFWLEGISDEYLQAVYASCTCLIAASEGEGFGLPLIEAAQKKMPIIARDIPVFKEVAGNYAYYFKSTCTTDELAKSVKLWTVLFEKGRHPKSEGMPWLTWEESTKHLLQQIIE